MNTASLIVVGGGEVWEGRAGGWWGLGRGWQRVEGGGDKGRGGSRSRGRGGNWHAWGGEREGRGREAWGGGGDIAFAGECVAVAVGPSRMWIPRVWRAVEMGAAVSSYPYCFLVRVHPE